MRMELVVLPELFHCALLQPDSILNTNDYSWIQMDHVHYEFKILTEKCCSVFKMLYSGSMFASTSTSNMHTARFATRLPFSCNMSHPRGLIHWLNHLFWSPAMSGPSNINETRDFCEKLRVKARRVTCRAEFMANIFYFDAIDDWNYRPLTDNLPDKQITNVSSKKSKIYQNLTTNATNNTSNRTRNKKRFKDVANVYVNGEFVPWQI